MIPNDFDQILRAFICSCVPNMISLCAFITLSVNLQFSYPCELIRAFLRNILPNDEKEIVAKQQKARS